MIMRKKTYKKINKQMKTVFQISMKVKTLIKINLIKVFIYNIPI